MEVLLVSWLSLPQFTDTGYSKEWVAKNLRILSNNGLHITLNSLKQLFNEDSPLNKYGLNNDQLLSLSSAMKEVFEKSQFMTDKEFIYIYKNSTNRSDQVSAALSDIIRNNIKYLILPISPLKNSNINSDSNNNSNSNSSSNSNSNSNNSNCNSDNSVTFFKIWRNLIIRNIITQHYCIARNNYHRIKFRSILELDNYRYKDYLRNIEIILLENKDVAIDGEFVNYYLENRLSPSVEILSISGDYSKYIRPYSIPSNITSLKFNQEKDIDTSLKKFVDSTIPLGCYGNDKLEFDGVKKVVFTNTYLSKIHKGLIPEGIESMSFKSINYPFNLDYDIFPSTLKTLSLGCQVGKKSGKRKFKIPNGVTKLKYDCFMELPNSLPSSITDLNVLSTFKQSKFTKSSLPPLLKQLKLKHYLFQIQHHILPSTLVVLKLPRNYFTTFQPGVLPPTLEYISFQNGTGKSCKPPLNPFKSIQPCLIKGSLPSSLKTLKLSPYINHMDTLIEPVLVQCKSLTKLSVMPTLAYDYKTENIKKLNDPLSKSIEWSKYLKYIPSSLSEIKCKSGLEYIHFVQSIPSTEFEFSQFNSFPLDFSSYNYRVLPNTITKLTFNNEFSCTIPLNALPKSLTILNFGHHYNKPIPPGLLPPSLTSLSFMQIKTNNPVESKYRFDSSFNQPLDSTNIPTSLKYLSLGNSYTHPIDIDTVFPNLTTLFIGSSNPTPLIFNNSTNSNLKNIIVFNTNSRFLKANHHLNNSILKVIDENSKYKQIKKLVKQSLIA